MMPKLDPFAVGRRSFLHQSAYGLGGIALAMLGREGQAAASAGLAKPADWRGRSSSRIFRSRPSG